MSLFCIRHLHAHSSGLILHMAAAATLLGPVYVCHWNAMYLQVTLATVRSHLEVTPYSVQQQHVSVGFSCLLFNDTEDSIVKEQESKTGKSAFSLFQLWQHPFFVFYLTWFRMSYEDFSLSLRKNSLNLLNFLGKFFAWMIFFSYKKLDFILSLQVECLLPLR